MEKEWTHSGKIRDERKSLVKGISGKTSRGSRFCSWSEVRTETVCLPSDFLLAKKGFKANINGELKKRTEIDA